MTHCTDTQPEARSARRRPSLRRPFGPVRRGLLRRAVPHMLLLAALLALVLPPTGSGQPRTAGGSRPEQESRMVESGLAVLAVAGGPYAPLAQRIATDVDGTLVSDLRDLEGTPEYLIWVAAPQSLTEAELLELSAHLAQVDAPPAVGIITGSTLDDARALWERDQALIGDPPGAQSGGPDLFAAGAFDHFERTRRPDTSPLIPEGYSGFIRSFTAAAATDLPLTQDALLRTLDEAEYLYWARHVGKRTWAWFEGEAIDEDKRLHSDELTAVGSVILHTPSCQSFTPWVEDNIAVAFIDAGAAAYVGHLYAPLSSGDTIGHTTSPPGIHSWPGVPMGTIAQLQGRASVRSSAAEANLFMLGDPRLSVLAEAPYTITSDDHGWPVRTITVEWAPVGPAGTGVLPLRIENAARPAGSSRFRFVRIKGLGAAADSDPFYNGRIQTLNAGFDKVVLLQHPGEIFEVELRRSPPPLWWLLDPVRDSLELVWIHIRPFTDPPMLAFVPLGVLLLVVATRAGYRWRTVRRARAIVTAGSGEKEGRASEDPAQTAALPPIMSPDRDGLPGRALRRAAVAGSVIATAQTLCFLLGARGSAALSYEVLPTAQEAALGALATWSLVTLGLWWSTLTRGHVGRVLGVLLACAQELLLAVFYTAGITFLNVLQAWQGSVGFWPLSYAPARQAAIALVVQLWLVLVCRQLMHRESGLRAEPRIPGKPRRLAGE